ncbi:Rad52/Rad22 family DNA repair protein [Paenibacillus periandrae]|uniref:Rad52/Rad22 family DNA repair protein n=1 Tax=Paenibacillus periandrae TaxID=1761741 RepID=UPI001F09EA0A|nr:Rad52/Rad22 family DNA repair protein [Paenibacillus periandrae]
MFVSVENTFESLNAPFHYDDYSVNHDGYVFVSPQATSDRLNLIFKPQGWKLEVIEQVIDMQNFSVSILGKIAIRSGDEWIEKSQFGDATMVIKNGKSEPNPQAILNAKKIALSDCLKKCASLIGIASDVYRGKLMVVPIKTKEYLQMADKYKLDTNKKQFKNGIVLLPDYYKPFYEQNNWHGIFTSDLQTLSNHTRGLPTGKSQEIIELSFENLDILKNKYKEGNGSIEGFDEWFQKLSKRGMNFLQLDFVLQEAINKKKSQQVAPNKDNEIEKEKNSNLSDNKNRLNQPEQTGNSDKFVQMNGILKDCIIVGEEKPYFKLLFDFRGISTEVYAVGPLMDEVEKLNLKQGDSCHISTREAKGKNLLREIRMAG